MFACRHLCLSLCLWLLCRSAAAQDLYRHYTVKDGLPTNTVHSITQDRAGHIWMATGSGAVRYDGHDFCVFGKADGLKTEDVFDVIPAPDGRLYLMDYADGLDYLYRDSLYSIPTPGNRINYINTSSGISYFNILDKTYVLIGGKIYAPDLRQELVKRGWQKAGGRALLVFPYLLSIKGSTVSSFDLRTGRMAHDRLPVPDSGKTGSYVVTNTFIYAVHCPDWIALYNPATRASALLSFRDPQGIAFNARQIIPTAGNIQITTEHGLQVYDSDFRPVDSFAIDTRTNGITALFRDRSRNIWMIMAGNGIRFVSHYYRSTSFFSDRSYHDILFEDNRLYAIDHYGNMVVSDSDLHTVQETPVRNVAINRKNIRSIGLYQTSRGIVAVSTKNVTLLRGGKLEDLIAPGVRSRFILSMKDACCVGDKIYLLHYNTLSCVDVISGKYSKMLNGLFTHFTIDSRGVIWLATDNKKLYALHRPQRWYDVYKRYPFLERAGELNRLLSDTSGNVILAHGSHLVVYHTRSGRYDHCDYRSRIIRCQLSNGRLLVCTDGFIDLYITDGIGYRRQNRFYNFGHTLYEDIAGIAVSDRHLYLATNTGVVRMPLANTLPVDSGFLYGTHTEALGNEDTLLRLPASTIPELKYTTGRTFFRFAGTAFSYGRDMVYRYFLEGVDRQWQTSRTPTVSYAALAPGIYALHVSASFDQYGLRSREHVLRFSVTPLWWQRRAVQVTLLLVALLLLLLLGSRWLLLRKNKQLQLLLLEKRASETQLAMLQYQMNPHFVFNALTSVQGFVKLNKNELANDYLLEFTQLIRMYLEFSRKRFVTLAEELQALRLFVEIERKRYSRRFDVRYYDARLPAHLLQVQIPPMILQPFVENAIHHGLYHKTDGPGLLELTLEGDERVLRIRIDDNGIGRERAQALRDTYRKTPSRGNGIIAERVRLLAEQQIMQIAITVTDKTDAAGQPAGTRVDLLFYLKNDL